MHALWTTFTLGPGTRQTVEKLGEQWAPILKSFKGFKSATFIGDDSAGEYAALSLWETKEYAEAALADTDPKVQQQIGSIAKGPVTRMIYEVRRVIEA